MPEQNTAKKVARAVISFGTYVLIIAIVVFGLPKFLAWSLNTPYPMAAITSGSMWPVLKEGDLVFIQGVDRGELGVGDIIVYRNTDNSGFTIHRIVKLEADELVTKGDANFTDDAPVKYESVVGKTYQVFGKYARLPYLGFVTVYATRK
ncbi:MAG: signal peptidase I [Patescibacteria group bacterium]